MARFVILEHDWPSRHYDFMLERQDALETWRLPKLPTFNENLYATYLAPHRLAYLDYEGPVSGNRGVVRRIEAGEYLELEWTSSRRVVELQGLSLRGRLELVVESVSSASAAGADPSSSIWLCRFEKRD